MKRYLGAALMAVFLISCSGAKEIDRDRYLGGYSMKATRLVVPADFSFKSQSTTLTLPAGEYEPFRVDADGAYFRSPGGVLVDRSNRTGGIYVDNSGKPTQVWVSFVYISKIAAIPREFRFEMAHQ